ncbi:MAG: pyruvate formate lyase family protein, partial [Cellulomonas sp.]
MSTTTVPTAATTHGAQAGAATTSAAWRDFVAGPWCDAIDVRDFIQRNYTEYTGDSAFLAGATERTTGIWARLTAMFPEERAKGVYDIDTHVPGTITSHGAGYIDQANELIVGLQTDAPLKRAMIPNGGWRMVETSLKTYGYEPDEQIKKIFTQYRKTHNQGVFDAYPPNVRAARSSHIITGLPDAYGRGRIIG